MKTVNPSKPPKRMLKFIMLLKELGVATYWLKCRKDFIKKRNANINIFDMALGSGPDSIIITLSFPWRDTEIQNYWLSLEYELGKTKTENILESQESIEAFDELLKKKL